jgi:putative transposase
VFIFDKVQSKTSEAGLEQYPWFYIRETQAGSLCHPQQKPESEELVFSVMCPGKNLKLAETESRTVRKRADPRTDQQPDMPFSGTGFQPVNPWESPGLVSYRRNLPHLQAFEATYFVTFRCHSDIILPGPARRLALTAMRYWDGKRIDLDAAVVMPDHAHAIFRIVDASTLSAILHSIKSFSSNQIHRRLGRKGPLWLDESFDHIIRNEPEWCQKLDYIIQNPVKNNLVPGHEHYPWIYLKETQTGSLGHSQQKP